MKKKALIFGVTGQDGSYLSESPLKNDELYDVNWDDLVNSLDKNEDIVEKNLSNIPSVKRHLLRLVI